MLWHKTRNCVSGNDTLGGVAIAAFSANPEKNIPTHFAMLDLPDLTDIFVVNLLESELGDEENTIIGGFSCAQRGNGFEQIVDVWEGATFYEQAMTLHEVCIETATISTLDQAAQEVLKDGSLAHCLNKLPKELSSGERKAITRPLSNLFLQYELARCLDILGTEVMRPVATWLVKKV